MLQTSVIYGIEAGMGEMRKITVEVPDDLLGRVQEYTKEGITDTVRAALKKLDGERAQQEFRKLRGSFKFSINLDELREDRTFSRKRK
jgi:Arc/MetJ-type ribon-helix-helix transcriptional regulator